MNIIFDKALDILWNVDVDILVMGFGVFQLDQNMIFVVVNSDVQPPLALKHLHSFSVTVLDPFANLLFRLSLPLLVLATPIQESRYRFVLGLIFALVA